MLFLKSLGKAVVQTAVPVAIAAVAPEAMINTAAGAVVKHGVKRANSAIPYLNLIISAGVSYAKHLAAGEDPVGAIFPAISEGGALAGTSTLLHQSIKLPLRSAVKGNLARKIGPGERLSV